jgi:hypothetical protein
MHMKKLIKKLINPAWKRPNVSDMWLITSISNHASFMGFVFDNVRDGEKWYIEMIFSESIQVRLNRISKEGCPIPLTQKNISALRPTLPDFDFGEDFVHHRICDDQQCLFVAYDNMSHCWLSKRIDRQQMTEAAQKYGFKYSENA